MKILVVDGYTYMRQVVKELLEITIPDVEVQEAESCLQALELIRNCAFDLVITDYTLGEMNGANLLVSALRESPLNAERWIFMSADPSELIKCPVVKSGNVPVINKSVIVEKLIPLVMGNQ